MSAARRSTRGPVPSPATGAAWATSVSDEGYQNELMHHVLERSNENDSNAARAALNGADLPAERREHFDEIFGDAPAITVAPDGDD